MWLVTAVTRQVQYGMFFLAIYEFSSHRIKPHNLVFSWGKFVDADDVSHHQHTRPIHIRRRPCLALV